MMKGLLVFSAFVLAYQPCACRSLAEEDSVVSVYTTHSTTAGTTAPLDVYRQIADNIAERITQPIYRFFGLGNGTTEEKTTKRPFEHIELDSTEVVPPTTIDKNDSKPLETGKTGVKTNEISPDRDVEELSAESRRKLDKKPEKITLFSSYLPVEVLPLRENFEVNVTEVDTNDNSLELDDVDSDLDIDDDKESGREGPFVYILELIGSIIQLLWGGFLAIFRPTTSSSS